jgi:hypothetical protein
VIRFAPSKTWCIAGNITLTNFNFLLPPVFYIDSPLINKFGCKKLTSRLEKAIILGSKKPDGSRGLNYVDTVDGRSLDPALLAPNGTDSNLYESDVEFTLRLHVLLKGFCDEPKRIRVLLTWRCAFTLQREGRSGGTVFMFILRNVSQEMSR